MAVKIGPTLSRLILSAVLLLLVLWTAPYLNAQDESNRFNQAGAAEPADQPANRLPLMALMANPPKPDAWLLGRRSYDNIVGVSARHTTFENRTSTQGQEIQVCSEKVTSVQKKNDPGF